MAEHVNDLVLEVLRSRHPEQDVHRDPKFPGYIGKCPLHEMRVALFFDKHGKPLSCAMNCSMPDIKSALGETEAAKAARAHGMEPPRESGFIMGKDAPKPVLENIIIALSTPSWAGLIAYDDLSLRPTLRGASPAHVERSVNPGDCPRPWEDSDDAVVTAWLQSTQHLMIRPAQMRDAVIAVAKRNCFHPIRDYLASLEWDRKPRLDTWLCDHLGAADTPLVRAFAAKFLISAVARVRSPGEKVDHMLILEGPQGASKSTALEALMPEREFFTDDLGDSLGKDSAERIMGKWLVEVAELDSMSRSEVTRIKSFITRTTDRFRPAYGRWAQDCRRQCVFAGSTNADSYLKDESGGRRFWPVRVGRINIMALRVARDQLWAEAAARYEAGETWWLDDDGLADAAREEQRDRYQEDVWHEKIATYVLGKDEVSVHEVLEHLGIQTAYQTQSEQTRVAKTLKSMCMERKQIRKNGGRAWVYRRVTTVTRVTL